jgi:hypothetical protein
MPHILPFNHSSSTVQRSNLRISILQPPNPKTQPKCLQQTTNTKPKTTSFPATHQLAMRKTMATSPVLARSKLLSQCRVTMQRLRTLLMEQLLIVMSSWVCPFTSIPTQSLSCCLPSSDPRSWSKRESGKKKGEMRHKTCERERLIINSQRRQRGNRRG